MKNDNSDFFVQLDKIMKFYDTIVEKSYTQKLYFSFEQNKKIMGCFYVLIVKSLQKGFILKYLKIANEMSFLGEKLGINPHSKNLLDQFNKYHSNNLSSDKIEQYYEKFEKNIDLLPDIEEYTKKMLVLFDENPLLSEFRDPINEKSTSYLNSLNNRQYFEDYLTRLCHTYESFTVVATFILILCRFLIDKPFPKLEEAISQKRKLPSWQIFEDIRNSDNNEGLLSQFLPKIFPDYPQLLEFCEWVYGLDGPRSIRNIFIHHKGEPEKFEYVDGNLKLSFRNGKTQIYTLRDIQNIYAQLFTTSMSMFLYINRGIFMCYYQVGKDIEAKGKIK